MEEGKQPQSKRDMTLARLKKKYPDKEYSDDESLFGQIGDDYDNYEKELGGYKERESKLTNLLANDPHSAQFITDMAKGKDPWASLINRIGIDGVKEMLDDPAKMEEYSAKNKEYMERLAKNKQLEDEWQTNMQSTLQMLDQKQKELGLSDEQIDKAADWIKEVTNDALTGVIKPETLDMALKAINYDKDMSAARSEGEVLGRNTKAEAQLRKPQRGDGTPMLAGANNAPSPQKKDGSIFDLAKEAS